MKQLTIKNELHLSVSVRSFRSEKLSAFVKAFLDLNLGEARLLFQDLRKDYPIVITRNIETAKHWVRAQASGITF